MKWGDYIFLFLIFSLVIIYLCALFSIYSVTPSLRETLILEYGTQFFTISGMWELGLTYLDHCLESGKGSQIILLSRLPLVTDHQANKIIRAAMARGLQEVGKLIVMVLNKLFNLFFINIFLVTTICKVRGMLYLTRGRLGNALAWALKSQDKEFATHLADKFLRVSLCTGIKYLNINIFNKYYFSPTMKKLL